MAASTTSHARLATIDIGPFIDPESTQNARQEVVNQVRQACLCHGFFIVTGHGISVDMQQGVLEQARKFFSLPLEEKMEMAESKSFGKSHRGYQAVRGERLQEGQNPDLKEGFQMGVGKPPGHPDCQAHRMLTGPNVWPVSLEPAFSTFMHHYFQLLSTLQQQLMQLIAQTLGVDYEKAFAPFCHDSLRGLRLLHYAPQEDERALGAGAHTDFGAITILLTDGVAGLQVLENDGQWLNIQTVPGSYIVNLGDMMKRMTAGLYKSAVHRVVNTSGAHRYSVPMFLDGNLDFVIVPVVDGPSPPTDRLTVEQHMMERFGTARDYIKPGISTGA
ncbi:hypothetical protein BX600DRAFT_515554 [Xylariales sp. PMI_506]|nr:hypothetical protein BX600DRAFT_515554 [Xylariales sp. PMI_506]